MPHDTESKPINQNDTFFFGMYLNQARLNAHITLCHISDLLGENTVAEDSLSEMPVLKCLEYKKDAVKSQRTMELIEEHFPMLKASYYWEKEKGKEDDSKERSKGYQEILQCLLKALNHKRNEYCHAKTAVGSEGYNVRALIRYLENGFDAAVNEVKTRRNLEDKEVFHLRRKTAEGRGRDKRTIDNPQFYYHFKDEQGQLSEKGLAFLASIFLERRDTYLFLKKLQGFKRGGTPAEKATLECFCCDHIRLPKPVMTSDVDKNGLALDMLNELKKCPKELFELLSKDKQQEFRVTDSEDTDEDGSEILMRRHSDRFDYFVLRYCDENEVFKNLRFQIDLGRYYFKFYEKTTIDGNTTQRSLDKRLTTFGRIREVKDNVKKEWGSLIKVPDEIQEGQEEPYKTNTTPHYNLVDNQIGLVFGNRNLPNLKQPNGKIDLIKPVAWLSIYELPGMIFHGLNFGFDQTEELIKTYIQEQRKICEDVCKTGIIPHDAGGFFPEALNETKASNTHYAKDKLQRMLEETDGRIRALRKTEERAADTSNKPGKKMFVDIRAGKLADFLARDILALQAFDPAKTGKDKLTSLNYQVLQATLAFYGANKDAIAEMFQKIGLLDGDNPHPFLKEVDPRRYNSIVRFYEAYLLVKQSYLKRCEKEGTFDGQFLRPSRQHYAEGKRDLKTIAKRLLDNPVNIPKGFFQAKIRDVVCGEISCLDGRDMNTAYMIEAYFEKKYGGQQPLYGYEKVYPVVEKAHEYNKKRTNEKIAKALRSLSASMSYKEMKAFIESEIPEKGRYDPETLRDNLLKGCKDFKDNERLLRRYKVQDMVIFQMVESTLREQLSFENKVLKLEAITPTENSPFKRPVPCATEIVISFNTKLEYEAKYVKFIRENYEGCYTLEGNRIILNYRVSSENTKLKDIGKYRRYFYDRRLRGLLIWKYPPTIEIKYAVIEEEIKAYEQHRLGIAKQLFILEKGVIDGCTLDIEPGEKHISFNRVIDAINVKRPEYKEQCDTLLNIRNAVFHNQFPAYEAAIETAEGSRIAEKMKAITEHTIAQIMKEFSHV